MAKFKNPIKSVLSEVAFKTVYSFLGNLNRFWEGFWEQPFSEKLCYGGKNEKEKL